MNTPTHVLVAEVAVGRRLIDGAPLAALVGGALPDLVLGVLAVIDGVGRLATGRTAGLTRWDEPWATFGAMTNSGPVWMVLIGLGVWLSRRAASGKLAGRGELMAVAGTAGLLHVVIDFLTHADDAHRHLWPLSSWAFHSPVSYWDHDHFAGWLIPLEAVVAIGSAVMLWPRFRSGGARILLLLAVAYTMARTVSVLAFAP